MTPRQIAFSLLFCLLARAAAGEAGYYEAAYRARIDPASGMIDVELNISGEHLPSRIVLSIDAQRHRSFHSTDPLQIGPAQVTWRPQGNKSRLRYQFVVDHERAPKRFDSLMTPQWAVFRGDKMVPRMRVTARRGLQSRASIEFEVPQGWSVITPYAPAGQERHSFDNPRRRFDRPEGWMLAGKIGTRNETIGGVRTTVAAPTGDAARRQDTLAFLNWNLPRLLEVFNNFPRRLLIVRAGDPMWRGGLSGPSSAFLHLDRPLVSENRTSSLLHELVHVAMGIHADEESDWIVEGLAEYYSLETLRRSGGISESRYRESIEALQKWARRAPALFDDQSNGPVTARAVLVLRSADAEIRAASKGRASLDDVARRLAAERGEVSLAHLQKIAAELAGQPLAALQRESLMKPVAAPAQ